MPNQPSPQSLIRKFLAQNFLLSDEEFPYPDDASLLDNGVVDSTGVLELMQFLEATFGIEIHDTEAVPRNLDSVQNMLAFLASKRAPCDTSKTT